MPVAWKRCQWRIELKITSYEVTEKRKINEKLNLRSRKEHFAGFNFTSASGSNLIFIDGIMSEPIIGTCGWEGKTQSAQVQLRCWFFTRKLKKKNSFSPLWASFFGIPRSSFCVDSNFTFFFEVKTFSRRNFRAAKTWKNFPLKIH